MPNDLETELADLLHDSGVEEGTEPWLASRIVAALRASGRLAPAVEGDLVERATHEALIGAHGVKNANEAIRKAVETAAPWIAAATEARVRQECAMIFSNLHGLPGENAMSIFRKIRGDIDQAPYPDLPSTGATR